MSVERKSIVRCLIGLATACGAAVALSVLATGFVSGQTKAGFDGKSLTGWRVLGPNSWRVDRGELVGTVQAGSMGSWLVYERAFQDLGVTFSFRCAAGCQSGILLGMEKVGDGTKGVFVSLANGDFNAYEITLDAQGQEVNRVRFTGGAGRGGGGGAGGEGGGGAAAAGGAGGRAGGGGGGRGALPLPAAAAGHPLAAPYPPPASLNADGWNQIEVRLYTGVSPAPGSLQLVVNDVIVNTGYTMPPVPTAPNGIAQQPEVGRFGQLALRVAGNAGAEVRFKDVSIASFTEIVNPVQKFSNRFRVQQINPYFYADGVAVADLNRDGTPDIIQGPVYWLGPDYRVGREIDVAQPLDLRPYAKTYRLEAADFTGDGWIDVLMSGPPPQGAYLYVNPHNELRRWPRYKVHDQFSEIWVVADIDGDGKPAVVYGTTSAASIAKPDPADPTKPWTIRNLTEPGPWGAHGLGVGDVNGDGRLDVLRAWGWWENPGTGATGTWPYHPELFGRWGPGTGPGGATMHVYDVNGDKLNDVVTSLRAHSYGLAWYEQKRDAQGKISFDEHMIMDRDPAQSRGVVFSEMHSVVLADVDGDGLKDIVTGKNKYNFGGHYFNQYPDEEAEGVLYWFKLVRRPKGQVDWMPYLIDNAHGAGRQQVVTDLNKDGVPDIVNSGRLGAYVFFGKKGAVD